MGHAEFRPPPARPLGLGGILTTALALFRVAPGAFILVAAVSTVPGAVLLIASDLAYGTEGTAGQQLLRLVVQVIPILLLGPISVAATTVIAADMLHGGKASASRALEHVADRFWPMVAVAAVTTLGVVVGLFAFIIPGIALLVLWLFAVQVSVMERRGVGESLSRSTGLVKGAFWWTLGSYLTISILVGVAALVASAVLSAPALSVDGNARVVAGGLATLVASTLIQPVGNLGLSLMFVERRLRAEGAWPPPVPEPRRDA